MNETKQMYIAGAVAIAGLILLFVIQWSTTGLLPYKEQVCTQVIPDRTLGITDCMIQARQACAEVHIPYISQTTRFNACYNECVRQAQLYCYE